MRARMVGFEILIAVEMQDRQDGAISDRIEELVGLPSGRQRTGLRLAIADNAGDDEPGLSNTAPKACDSE
jgi:hypothetical protein